MTISDIDIRSLIKKASDIIAPLWPMQTIIARNPLHGIEALNFEDAVAMGEQYLACNPERPEHHVNEVNRQLIKWCQVFLDEGQAAIAMPEREKGFYRAWAALAPYDQQLRPAKKNEWLSTLPPEPEEAILFCLKMLNIPNEQIEAYFRSALAELAGWAGYIKWREEWQSKSDRCHNPITLTEFLAVRLAIACALDEKYHQKDFSHLNGIGKEFFDELYIKEESYLKNLLNSIVPQIDKHTQNNDTKPRSDAQMVFCIDVRSEPFRSCIEKQGKYATFGFAGFFGLPVSIHNYNTGEVKDCCPVLLKPRHQVFEEPLKGQAEQVCRHRKGRNFLDAWRRCHQGLKYNFATPYALVETLGVWYGLWMGLRTLLPTGSMKFKRAVQEQLKPNVLTFPKIDIPFENQVSYAESALRMIGLTNSFAPLVLFCGHRGATENNPYASALDCGACGGNHGGPNAKILAAILNTPEVRANLAAKGIIIPEDTLFLGAEHNTTTDEVVIADQGGITGNHKDPLERLKSDLQKARSENCQRRCKAFGVDLTGSGAVQHVMKRSCDWSEVRPEWGLAGNAAFIVGPRSLTQEIDLEGRCFLHSYDWQKDAEGKSLEAILTAPMVVAEWINTQYFFSTLNNRAYGSGSKITHNICGKLGIMQGNGSDLMQGLPFQSVYVADGVRYHDPMRLQTVVYAPCAVIDSIVKKHAILQTLFQNGWVILTAIDPINSKAFRLSTEGGWEEVATNEAIDSPCKTYQAKTPVSEKLHNESI